MEMEDEEEEGGKQKGPKHLKDKVREEKEVRKQERRQMTEKGAESVEEFEKLLVARPNESYLWLQYVAFILDNAGLESARRVQYKTTCR